MGEAPKLIDNLLSRFTHKILAIFIAMTLVMKFYNEIV